MIFEEESSHNYECPLREMRPCRGRYCAAWKWFYEPETNYGTITKMHKTTRGHCGMVK